MEVGRLGATGRRDAWWATPLATALVYGGFIVYGTWSAFNGVGYFVEPYLSPFYSPLIHPAWLPAWISPAHLILWAPLGFRISCYYYRRSYYRAFTLDPPACAVGEPRRRYTGETAFPLVIQNFHRFFMVAAIGALAFLWFDAGLAFRFPDPGGGHRFGVGLGSLVLLLNVCLLSGYTLGCHSLRHLVGGGVDCFSCAVAGRARYRAWRLVSLLNGKHAQWAWFSLFSVSLADVYVRLVAAGRIVDPRLF
jgi:hypothetical protein